MAKNQLSDEEYYREIGVNIKKEVKDTDKDLIEKIQEDFPDPEEFVRKLIRFSDAPKKLSKYTAKDYINAVYFCSLYAQGLSQVESYSKVFPERVAKKSKGTSTISNSANSYFHSMMVQSVWNQVNVADHMLFIDKRFKAYNKLEQIMDDPDTSKRDAIDAAGKLANLLKPPKEAEVRLDINYQSSEIKALEEKLSQLANNQLHQLQNGDISARDIVDVQLIERKNDDE